MQYRVFRVAAVVGGAASEQDELNSFLRKHRIVSVRSDFYTGVQDCGYCFVVEYVGDTAGGSPGDKSSKKPPIDYREVLPPDQFVVFSRLRVCRKQLSEQHGVPIYTVFTNERLAEITRTMPKDLAQLAQIAGIGNSRVENYGAAVLRVLLDGQ